MGCLSPEEVKSTTQLIINIRKHLEDVAPYLVKKFDDLARQLSKMADGTQPDTGTGLNPETADVNHWVPGTDGKIVGDVVNSAGRQIVLKNGFYEVEGGMKISQNYYENLWKNGRPAPFIQAEEILKSKPKVTLDPKERPGFQRYEANGLEMIFNPTTKEIWHIQPVKK